MSYRSACYRARDHVAPAFPDYCSSFRCARRKMRRTSGIVWVAGNVVIYSAVLSYTALAGTLLYFDLRAKGAEVLGMRQRAEDPAAP